MFALPPELTTSVFAELPAEFRNHGRTADWFFGRGPEADSFLEGPAFDRMGNLWVCDIPFGRIFKVDRQGRFELAAEYDGEPNGLQFHRDGSLYITDHRRGLMRLDPATGKVEAVLNRVRREGFKGTNDLVFASNGDIYFTDQGQTGLQDPSGRVFRLNAATGHTDMLVDCVPSPNGLVLTADEKTLIVAVTRANQIWRLPLHPDGSTTKVSLFLQLQGGLTGPDGLAIDAEDNLAIAHCGLGTVWLFSRLGEPLYRIRSCRGLQTTNLCYGGEGGRSLFITESETGTILKADLPVAGRRLFSHA